MNYCELAPSYVRAIAPYQPGKPIAELERELGVSGIVKLASNENPLGVSPFAVAAMHAAISDVARYPDGSGFDLKKVLSERYKLERTNIVLGNGSNDLLELVARAFLAPGDKAVYSQYAFAVYALATQAIGATGVVVPATKGYGHDLAAMKQAVIQHKSKMVFIANPNNPTGTFLGADELHDFLRTVPSHVLVVLDEAYNEYLSKNFRYDSVNWLRDFPNLIISRTFSKAYGLAGLRVGYALANEQVADMLNRVRQPFNVNSVAQAAAIAALRDEDFVMRTCELNLAGMEQVTQGITRLGLEYIPSYGNFVCCRIPDTDQSKVSGAARMYRRLLELGVIVRPVVNYDMPDYLRVSIGLHSENEKFLSALEQALGETA